jgi:hypothetical protein
MCVYHQTSPDSNFVSGSLLCTRATPGGRIWVRNNVFVEATPAGKTERTIGDDERIRTFKEYFAIDLTEQ